MGFKINPYELCVANKVINGKHCTISWYVEYLKVSHVEETFLKYIIKQINKSFCGLKFKIVPI